MRTFSNFIDDQRESVWDKQRGSDAYVSVKTKAKEDKVNKKVPAFIKNPVQLIYGYAKNRSWFF